MEEIDFNGALAGLMAWVDKPVQVAFAGFGPESSHVMDVTGTLVTGWDPEVAEANGLGDSALFRIAEYEGFALYVLADDFKEGVLAEDGTVYLHIGGARVVVGPPMWPSNE